MKSDLETLQGIIIMVESNTRIIKIYHANMSAVECRALMTGIIDALQVRIHELEERFPVSGVKDHAQP